MCNRGATSLPPDFNFLQQSHSRRWGAHPWPANGVAGTLFPALTDDLVLGRFRARLARPRAAQRVDALLSSPDPEAAVAGLSIPELYFTIAEVGLADAYELVGLATPEQFQGCLDLSIWDRDEIQDAGLMPWLAALTAAGFERFGQIWSQLDPELSALVLQRHARIYDKSLEEEPPEDSELPRFETPDRFFIIELTSERDEDVKLVHEIIENLYRFDMAVARHALMAARSELPSELEEMSYRWRSGRLADLGYVDFYDALEVFRPIDMGSIEIGEGTHDRATEVEVDRGPGNLPAPMLERVVGRAFLARALAHITDPDEITRLEAAMIILVNRVLSAARVRPGDEEAVVIATEHATSTLALGLEVISRGDPERAAQALRSIALTRLHRLGYTVTARLARLARQIAPRATTAGDPASAVLEAALMARPFFPRVLDDPPGADVRPFESLADVTAVATVLRELTARIAVATALGVDLVAMADKPEPRPELDDHARTAVVRLLGSGDLDPAPLSVDELRSFLAADRDATAAVDALVARVAESEIAVDRPTIESLVDRWLAELDEELAGVDLETFDPRFVGKVLLRAALS